MDNCFEGMDEDDKEKSVGGIKESPGKNKVLDKDSVHRCRECISRTREDHLTECSGRVKALSENG